MLIVCLASQSIYLSMENPPLVQVVVKQLACLNWQEINQFLLFHEVEMQFPHWMLQNHRTYLALSNGAHREARREAHQEAHISELQLKIAHGKRVWHSDFVEFLTGFTKL